MTNPAELADRLPREVIEELSTYLRSERTGRFTMHIANGVIEKLEWVHVRKCSHARQWKPTAP